MFFCPSKRQNIPDSLRNSSCDFGKFCYSFFVKEKTRTWLELAENDLELAQSIVKNKNRAYFAVHFCHQAIEKILKAIVQERTEVAPKRTHNFKALCEQANIALPASTENFLIKLAPHYLASRYPEDLQHLYKKYTESYVRTLLQETTEAFQWCKSYLISKP